MKPYPVNTKLLNALDFIAKRPMPTEPERLCIMAAKEIRKLHAAIDRIISEALHEPTT